jgi:hypothetical protein
MESDLRTIATLLNTVERALETTREAFEAFQISALDLQDSYRALLCIDTKNLPRQVARSVREAIRLYSTCEQWLEGIGAFSGTSLSIPRLSEAKAMSIQCLSTSAARAAEPRKHATSLVETEGASLSPPPRLRMSEGVAELAMIKRARFAHTMRTVAAVHYSITVTNTGAIE